jgi:hypothetical protein
MSQPVEFGMFGTRATRVAQRPFERHHFARDFIKDGWPLGQFAARRGIPAGIVAL